MPSRMQSVSSFVAARIRSAPWAILSLVRPLTITIVVVASLAWLFGGAADTPHSASSHGVRSLVRDEDGNYHDTLDIAKEDVTTSLIIHNTRGEAIVAFRTHANGSYTIEPTGEDQGLFIVHRPIAGTVHMGTRSARNRLALTSRPASSAEMLVKEATVEAKVVHGVLVTKEGKILPHEGVSNVRDAQPDSP